MLHTKKKLPDQILNQTLKSDYEAVLIESQKLQKRRKEEVTVIKLKAQLYSAIIVGKLQKLRNDELTIIKQETQIEYKTAVKDLQKLQKLQKKELLTIKQQTRQNHKKTIIEIQQIQNKLNKELEIIKQKAIYDCELSKFQIQSDQNDKDHALVKEKTVLSQTWESRLTIQEKRGKETNKYCCNRQQPLLRLSDVWLNEKTL